LRKKNNFGLRADKKRVPKKKRWRCHSRAVTFKEKRGGGKNACQKRGQNKTVGFLECVQQGPTREWNKKGQKIERKHKKTTESFKNATRDNSLRETHGEEKSDAK